MSRRRGKNSQPAVLDGVLYLIHFSRKYRHAGHYIGFALDVEIRFAEHVAGQGARLTQVVRAAGIELNVVRTWSGTRATERRLKQRKDARSLCPECHAARLAEKRAARRRAAATAAADDE